MSNLQSSPQPSSWQKGTFTIIDESPKKVKLKGHVLPTLIQFHVRRTGIVKFTFNRNSGERLAPDTHFTAASWKGPPPCPESAHTSRFTSWTPAKHSVTAGSYSQCMWPATRDSISVSQQCLVLVGWVGLYSLE